MRWSGPSRALRAILLTVVVTLAACSPAGEPTGATEPTVTTSTTAPEAVQDAAESTTTERTLPTTGPPLAPMELTSPAFEQGQPIPTRFTCDGRDISPELVVSSTPPGTITLAIIVDDPDAPVGVWNHWVEYDIEPTGVDVTWEEDAGRIGVPGLNSWNLPGYGGPCPPPGEPHRYFFRVFALDTQLLIPEGVDADSLRVAMEGHVLSEAELMGTYSR